MEAEVIIGLVALAVGTLVLLFGAIPSLRKWRRSSTARLVSLGSGLQGERERVAVEGKARALEEEANLLESPVEGRQCVAYTHKIERREYRNDNKGSRRWRTVSSDQVAIPFLLDDDSGRMEVQAERPSVMLSKRRSRRHQGGGGLSIGPVSLGGTPERHTEVRLEPGDFCSVIGVATAAEGGLKLLPASEGEAIIISDRPYRSLLRRLLLQGVLVSLAALALIGFGGAFLLDYYGVIETPLNID